MKNTNYTAQLVFGVVLCFGFAHAVAAKVSKSDLKPESWTSLARKVGQSESDTERDGAMKALKRIQDLSQSLRLGLTTNDRPLALETISALKLKGLIPELLSKVSSDPDGFLTLAINSMTDFSNETRILNKYESLITSDTSTSLSPPTVVAVLEPLGRLGVRLPRKTLLSLIRHRSPDVQSATIYYLRMMSLRNGKFENLDLLNEMTTAPQYQLRLQAISVISELRSSPKFSIRTSKLPGREDLTDLCLQERRTEVKESCLFFLSTSVASAAASAASDASAAVRK